QPGEIFEYFFDNEVLTLVCDFTNKGAARNLEKGRKFSWTEISPGELKKFIGMLLYMSISRLPKIRDFWRTGSIFSLQTPATIMSRDWFLAILANVRMSDPEEDQQNDKLKGTETYDPLHRVRPLMEMIGTRCRALCHPRQHLAVDERYMKAKPTKWGLKFFVLADKNGYTVDFQLYTGKSNVSSGKGLSFDVVTTLVRKEYLGSGYIVYTDNFYTSPVLFKHLRTQGFGACGTYRQGRVGVPTTTENALTKKSPRGSIRWIRDGELLFVKWMDTREVSMCSTIHPVYTGESVQRWQKSPDGKVQKVAVPRPTAVTEYNKYMGGVDTSDQMIGTHSIHRKTKRW
uniref:Si:dkey-19f4.2 n=1 Tax=Poecilia formosa TaxID=48698 RepID=A0A096M2S4_POEFO